MLKYLKAVIILFIIGSFLVAGCGQDTDTEDAQNGAPTESNDTYELLFATFESEQMGFMTEGLVQFGDDLMERTDGRVQVTYSFNSELGSIPEYYDLVVQGVADVTFCPTFMVQGRFPMAEITTLPFHFPSSEIGTQAIFEMYKQGFLDDAYNEGVKVLFVSTGTSDVIFHVDKPVYSAADLKGQRIICRGTYAAASVEAMGGAPTMIQGPDVYTALERGTVEGQVVGFNTLPQWGWCEVQKFATPAIQGCATWAMFMNENTYNSLPADIQEIIDEMAADNEYGMIGARRLDSMAAQGLDCFIEKGGELLEWEGSAYDELNVLFAPIWEDWIAERDAMGLPAKEAVDTLYNTLMELGVERPAFGYQP